MDTQEKLDVALKALAFYADPTTYHGIAVLADQPTGGFDEDVSDTEYYDYPKPGKLARETFRALSETFENYLD